MFATSAVHQICRSHNVTRTLSFQGAATVEGADVGEVISGCQVHIPRHIHHPWSDLHSSRGTLPRYVCDTSNFRT